MMLLRWCQEGKGFIAQVLKDGDNKGGFYWRYASKGKDPLVWVQSQAPKGTLGECIDEVLSMFGSDEIESSMTPWVSRHECSNIPRNVTYQEAVKNEILP